MIVGCFTLDLYCDNPSNDNNHEYKEFPHQYTGETRAICYRKARKQGWLIGRTKCYCPKCSGKGKSRAANLGDVITLDVLEKYGTS